MPPSCGCFAVCFYADTCSMIDVCFYADTCSMIDVCFCIRQATLKRSTSATRISALQTRGAPSHPLLPALQGAVRHRQSLLATRQTTCASKTLPASLKATQGPPSLSAADTRRHDSDKTAPPRITKNATSRRVCVYEHVAPTLTRAHR